MNDKIYFYLNSPNSGVSYTSVPRAPRISVNTTPNTMSPLFPSSANSGISSGDRNIRIGFSGSPNSGVSGSDKVNSGVSNPGVSNSNGDNLETLKPDVYQVPSHTKRWS